MYILYISVWFLKIVVKLKANKQLNCNDAIENNCANYMSRGMVLLIGVLNSRTGKEKIMTYLVVR